MTEPRFSNADTQANALDTAHGRCGAVSERAGLRRFWYPTVNGRRIPCARPFESEPAARAAARQFRADLRDELGETE